MLTNAFEATETGGEVRLWFELDEEWCGFCVWNEKCIPDEIRLRIFQRNFSTKQGTGRGLGTYSMKLFGEQFLKGKVDFETSPQKGTVFRLTLPLG